MSNEGSRESLAIAYAWQMTFWERLSQQHLDQKLPHALMLTGHKGIGKFHFAKALGYYQLCLSPVNHVACGRCKGCELNQAETHPDFFVLRPEGTSRVIKIDQVRRLTEFLAKTAQQGGKKVAVIEPVEALNVNAANALLKGLEEPSGNSSLILVSHVPSQVMATIRSRCQQIAFPLPSTEESLTWLTPLAVGQDPAYLLSCAGGAPLAARDLLSGDALEQRQALATGLLSLADNSRSALDLAAELQRGEALPVIESLMQWLQYGLKRQMTEGVAVGNPNEDKLLALIGSIPSAILYRFWDKMVAVKRQLLSSANPNKQLLLEELMMDWQAMCRQSSQVAQSRQQVMNGLL
ncbi:DNA polymerase III subunit delta' [Pseudomaricurvus sp.]|uniref:DNA polymerase III subunit delta' n=1 Tax=Pseudomaricurvus sp. TaxID=2004510 RepID=UPI003F6D005E